VLAAFAFWAQQNIKETDADARQRIAAICSLIRFPDIPASVLLSYHKCHSFMRTFDPDRELLCMAVSEATNQVKHSLLCLDSGLLVLACRSRQLPIQ
jgi:hypothetical protein